MYRTCKCRVHLTAITKLIFIYLLFYEKVEAEENRTASNSDPSYLYTLLSFLLHGIIRIFHSKRIPCDFFCFFLLKKTDNSASFEIHVHVVETRAGGQTRHGHDISTYRVDVTCANSGSDIWKIRTFLKNDIIVFEEP